MTDEELVSELRKLAWSFGTDAADRIEALVKERDGYREICEQREEIIAARTDRYKVAEARAERLEAALQKLACNCPSNCDWEHGDICPSWIARAALKGAEHD